MKEYRVNLRVRIINFLARSLIRLGLAPRHTYLLTVQGRKSGKSYSTPVMLVENESERWLVAIRSFAMDQLLFLDCQRFFTQNY